MYSKVDARSRQRSTKELRPPFYFLSSSFRLDGPRAARKENYCAVEKTCGAKELTKGQEGADKDQTAESKRLSKHRIKHIFHYIKRKSVIKTDFFVSKSKTVGIWEGNNSLIVLSNLLCSGKIKAHAMPFKILGKNLFSFALKRILTLLYLNHI